MNSNCFFMAHSLVAMARAINNNTHKYLIFACLILSACGGDGASTASMENDLPSPVASGIEGENLVPGPQGKDPASAAELALLPTVSVSQRQFADPNVLINLTGAVEAAEGAQITRTLWTQVSGPEVRIPSPLQLNNLILMPDVNIATSMEFRLTAEDSEGRVNSATVAILVKPVPVFVKVVGGVFDEADEQAIFTLRLNAPSDLPVTLSYLTRDGSANSESDFVYTSGEIVLEPGELEVQVPVLVRDDTQVEGDENFSLQVTALNGEVTYANVGVVIIRDGTEPQLQQDLQFSNPGPINIYPGDEYVNTFDPNVASPGTGDIIYSSSNSSVASVTSAGVVLGNSVGTTEITATKLADDNYLSVSSSYTLQVVSRGATPEIGIEPGDGYSILLGDTMDAFGYAFDEEDGSLPTEAQIQESSASGEPISSLQWTSNLDGFLNYGTALDTADLTMGTHLLTYSATDSDGNTGTGSIRVLVGNIAYYYAGMEASSTYCPDDTDCYSVVNLADGNLSNELDSATSWTNAEGELPAQVTLYWESTATINTVDIYTSETYPISDYDVQYFDGENTWITLVSVDDNTELYRSHPVPGITTSQLRINVRSGPATQPQYGRINELVVFGTLSEPPNFEMSASAQPARAE